MGKHKRYAEIESAESVFFMASVELKQFLIVRQIRKREAQFASFSFLTPESRVSVMCDCHSYVCIPKDRAIHNHKTITINTNNKGTIS